MLARGISEWMAEVLNEYANAHSAGYSDWTTDSVERLTGHPATSYQQFARDFAMVFPRRPSAHAIGERTQA